MNMVNFLDGLDGLAAGVCAISALSFCVIDLSRGDVNAAILTAVVFGACVGFLRHNFYPARIFMGDSGALLLGFTLAAVSVQGLSKTAALPALVLPLLVLAVPLIDTSFVVAKRIKHGRPIYVADRTHLHHRFAEHRLLAAPLGPLPLRLVRDARARGVRDAVRPPAPGTATGTWPGVAIDAAIGLARDRRLGLRRLPARDRQAREPVHPPAPRGGVARKRRARPPSAAR